jgi:hypothetical protein
MLSEDCRKNSANGNIIYPSIALMFLFCFLDNIIYVEEGTDGDISWNTKVPVDGTNYSVEFHQLSNQTDDLIYASGILQKNSSKYKYFNTTGLHIQFTLTQVNKLDVGLYQSMSIWSWYHRNHWHHWSSIHGCAFLVMESM